MKLIQIFFLTGCGTGKYLKVNSQVRILGCDYCEPLVEIARSRGCEVMVCDNLNLPFRDQGFDAIISIGGKAAVTCSHFAMRKMHVVEVTHDPTFILCRAIYVFTLFNFFKKYSNCLRYLTKL